VIPDDPQRHSIIRLMLLPRFLVPSLDADSREVTLPSGEARHLTRVLRLGTGARVAVFDGSGREFVATVATSTRDRVTVRLEEPVEQRPEPRVPIVLAQSILKSDKMDDVVRDATMLGVSGIVPLLSDHVSVKPAAIKRGRPEERWRRIAVASVKQCRRSTIPAVHDAVPFTDWLGGTRDSGLVPRQASGLEVRVSPGAGDRAAGAGDRGPGVGGGEREARHSERDTAIPLLPVAFAAAPVRKVTLLLVEPELSSPKARSIRSLLGEPPPTHATIAVGPEGGWSAREVKAAIAAGCVPVTLGGLTLRADAVALVALSALMVVWGE
jgi:16S rRNA (uracil1498-N3)-methyltransferase